MKFTVKYKRPWSGKTQCVEVDATDGMDACRKADATERGKSLLQDRYLRYGVFLSSQLNPYLPIGNT
jgi:hypothetical protein